MEARSKEMEAMSAQIEQEVEAALGSREQQRALAAAERGVEREMERLARQQERIGRAMERAGLKMEQADERTRAQLQKDMDALHKEMEPLSAEMARRSAEMAQHHAQLAARHAAEPLADPLHTQRAFDHLLAAFARDASAQPTTRWRWLEAAHVLGQTTLSLHWRSHTAMLRYALQLRDLAPAAAAAVCVSAMGASWQVQDRAAGLLLASLVAASVLGVAWLTSPGLRKALRR